MYIKLVIYKNWTEMRRQQNIKFCTILDSKWWAVYLVDCDVLQTYLISYFVIIVHINIAFFRSSFILQTSNYWHTLHCHHARKTKYYCILPMASALLKISVVTGQAARKRRFRHLWTPQWQQSIALCVSILQGSRLPFIPSTCKSRYKYMIGS